MLPALEPLARLSSTLTTITEGINSTFVLVEQIGDRDLCGKHFGFTSLESVITQNAASS